MREVRFKNKEAKHSMNVLGKNVEFKDGVAFVFEAEAQFIEDRKDSDYDVLPSAEVEQVEIKPDKKARGNKRKPKKK